MITPRVLNYAWAPRIGVHDPKRTVHISTRAERCTYFSQVLRWLWRSLRPHFSCMGFSHVKDKLHLPGTVFSWEDQSWVSAAFSNGELGACLSWALLAGRVRGSMWGTHCIWLSSPPCDGTFRHAWTHFNLRKKKSDKQVLIVGALLRKEAMSYTALDCPNQDIPLYSLPLAYPPFLCMLFHSNTQIQSM